MASIVCTMTLYSQGVSFAWQGMRMVHPSNYVITDKEFNGETYDFCCEIGNDDISMINFSIIKNSLFELLSKEEAIEATMEGLDEAVGELRRSYTSMKVGETKVNRNHRYAYVYRTFTGHFMGTLIYGKIVVIAGGDKYICMVLQAESQTYLRELEEIVNSVRID